MYPRPNKNTFRFVELQAWERARVRIDLSCFSSQDKVWLQRNRQGYVRHRDNASDIRDVNFWRFMDAAVMLWLIQRGPKDWERWKTVRRSFYRHLLVKTLIFRWDRMTGCSAGIKKYWRSRRVRTPPPTPISTRPLPHLGVYDTFSDDESSAEEEIADWATVTL